MSWVVLGNFFVVNKFLIDWGENYFRMASAKELHIDDYFYPE